MIRPVFTELALFLAPFVVYAIVPVGDPRGCARSRRNWPLSRIAWLLIAALVLMIGSFVVLAHWSGAPPGSTYVPAHVEDGKFVPGQTSDGGRRAARCRLAARGRRWRALLAVLDRDGEEARVVGGAVRNALLGEPLGDIDIATTALPQEVIRRVEAAGFKPVPTGIEHGTITVVADGRPFEVTTLREDVETYGRHAKVVFGRDWRRDAERRDFTMNALSAVARRHHPRLRRRACRSRGAARALHRRSGAAHRRGLSAHPALLPLPCRLWPTARPIRRASPPASPARAGLDTLSRERVRMELLKLLLARHAVPALAVMAEAGLARARCSAACRCWRASRNMIKLEAELALAPDPVRRLGALGVSIVEDAERLRERLRLTNAEYERLASMADALVADLGARSGEHGRARPALPARARDAIATACCWPGRASPEGAADARWRALATLPARWTAPVFPLKAADFIARGVPSGPRARRGAARGRGSLDRGGISARSSGAGADCRCGAGASDLTRCAPADRRGGRAARRLALRPVPHYIVGQQGSIVQSVMSTIRRPADVARRSAKAFAARPRPRDAFRRETFALPREAAREKAREMFRRFPKAAYMTEIESWRELPDDRIEFTMRRLPSAD